MSELQLKKLQKRIEWAMEKSAFYYRHHYYVSKTTKEKRIE